MNIKQLYNGIVKRKALITGLTGIVIGGLMLKPYIHLPKKLDNQTIEYETNDYSRKNGLHIGLGFSLGLLSLGFLEYYSEKRKREIEDMIKNDKVIKKQERAEMSIQDQPRPNARTIDYYLKEHFN